MSLTSRLLISPGYRLNNEFASHNNTLSSHPTLATHPPAPKRHQSTPVANSVCRFISPSCLPGLTGAFTSSPTSGPPIVVVAADDDPSVHTRTVMS